FAAGLAAFEGGGKVVAAGDEHALAELLEQLGMLALLDEQCPGEPYREAPPSEVQVRDEILAGVAGIDRRRTRALGGDHPSDELRLVAVAAVDRRAPYTGFVGYLCDLHARVPVGQQQPPRCVEDGGVDALGDLS